MLSRYFYIFQSFEITIIAKFFKNVAKYLKDSIFRAKISAKLSLKYSQNFRCRNTTWVLGYRLLLLVNNYRTYESVEANLFSKMNRRDSQK